SVTVCADRRSHPSFPTRRSPDLGPQPRNILPGPSPWLGPGEPGTDPCHQRIQLGHSTIQHHTTDLPASTHASVVAVLTDAADPRSEEHTSELQSREDRVCRLLLE